MKVILTGATGFVGGEILKQLIAEPEPEVERITCLTRRPIESKSPKVRVLLHEDFSGYPADLLDDLATHDACLWAIGGKASDLGAPEHFARVTHDYTLALANGLEERLCRPFTFCYLSGMGADPSETASFPWELLTRHLKGRTERHLLDLHAAMPAFRVLLFRPGGILPADSHSLLLRLLAPIALEVRQLAAAMISGALWPEGLGAGPVILHREIRRFSTAGSRLS